MGSAEGYFCNLASWAGFTGTIKRVDFSPFMLTSCIFVLLLILTCFTLKLRIYFSCVIYTTTFHNLQHTFSSIMSYITSVWESLGHVKSGFMSQVRSCGSKITVMWWCLLCMVRLRCRSSRCCTASITNNNRGREFPQCCSKDSEIHALMWMFTPHVYS